MRCASLAHPACVGGGGGGGREGDFEKIWFAVIKACYKDLLPDMMTVKPEFIQK